MKLDKLVLVNWGQVAPGDYPMGQLTLLLGETGAGKSTMLDALQTVMTGYHKGVLVYNPGQDEVAQGAGRAKTKRSLESYIAGAEGNRFSRPQGAQGYIAAVFRPDQGEEGAKTFSAIVAASARVEGHKDSRQAKLETFSLFIVDHDAVQYDDFMEDPEAGVCIPSEAIGRRLKSRYSRVVEFQAHKGDFLSALYGRFRGKTTVPKDESMQAAKAWVQSLAYKPMGSVHDLVRDEILDFDAKALQDEVDHISSVMRNVANLRKEGQRLEQSVKLLDHLKHQLNAVADAHAMHVGQGFYVAKLALEHNSRASSTLVAQEEALTKELGALNTQEGQLKQLTLAAQKRLADIQAQLAGVPAHQQKTNYEQQAATAVASIQRTLGALQAQLRAAAMVDNVATRALQMESGFGLSNIEDALKRVSDSRDQAVLDTLNGAAQQLSDLDAVDLNPDAIESLAKTFSRLPAAPLEGLSAALLDQTGLQTAVIEAVASLTQKLNALGNEHTTLKGDIARLESGGSTYPREVEAAVVRLKEGFPEANIRVLCDLIEPASAKWQPAIEGYMGGARFNLVVDPDWEREVTSALKASRWTSIKVVQGALCLKGAQGKALHTDSIVHELRTDHPIARAYLVDHFGPVLKVKSVEELRHTPRGLTIEGHGAGSRTMFPAEAKDLVFGQAARARQLDTSKKSLKAVEDAQSEVGGQKNKLEQLKPTFARLQTPSFDTTTLAGDAQGLRAARLALSQLDLSDAKNLQDQLTQAQQSLGKLQDEMSANRTLYGTKDSERKTAAGRLVELKNARYPLLEQAEAAIGALKARCDAEPGADYARISSPLDVKLLGKLESLEAARAELASLASLPAVRLSEAREAVGEYNRCARSDEQFQDALPTVLPNVDFAPHFVTVLALLKRVTERAELLRGTGLLTNGLELAKATASFNDVFTKNFCSEIKSKVDNGPRTLRQMNQELDKLKFGHDSYQIEWSKWEPEFEEYRDFFEAVHLLTESTDSPDLFGATVLSEKHVRTRDRLVGLLLDEDQDRAMRELLRIADYRNYRRYDIINESETGGSIRLSEWGTGSGGQLETPAYVVRAAVVSNRLKLFEKGPSLRMLGNDESFSRMDEPRSRAVLTFLRESLDLQLISAMPTMKAGPLKDEFTKEYSFSSVKGVENGELNFVTEIDERDLSPDRMRELWAKQKAVAREKAKQLFDEQNPVDGEPQPEGVA